MWRSELLDLRPDFFQVMESPFDGQKVVVCKALVPDYAILHVQEADEFGNARILGSDFQDVLLSRAAKKTIITTENIVDTDTFRKQPKLTSVPYFLVEAVVHVPNGAKPGICYPYYNKVDDSLMKGYSKAVKAGTLDEYLASITEGRA